MLTDYGDKNWCESQRLKEETNNDLGEKFMTETALAAYSSAQSNTTYERGIARMGFCLPKECTQGDIDDFFEKYMDTAAFGLGALSEFNMGMNSMIMRPWSVPGMKVTKTNSRIDEW